MLSLKENVMETLKNGNPDAFINGFEPFELIFDPTIIYMLPYFINKGKIVKDPWGVSVYLGENEPGGMPLTDGDKKVCPDITEWKKYVTAPDIENVSFDWTHSKEEAEKIRKNGKLVTVMIATGMFEETHYLCGFEDALMNVIDEPEATKELVEYITDFKIKHFDLLYKELNPDVFIFQDDWGSKTSLFMQPSIWREIFKPAYERFFGHVKKSGVILMHHCDSFCEPLIQDMVDIGIDIWQGVLPTNDIQKLKKETNGKLMYMGGLDAQSIDRGDATEEQIRAEVARACKEYHEGGCFIPCITYGAPLSIYPHVYDIISDEVRNQNSIYFK